MTIRMQQFNNIDEILIHYLLKLNKNGGLVSPRGKKTKELLSVSFKLCDPRSRIIHNQAREWSFRLATGEFLWHINASDDVSFISHYAPIWEKFSDEHGKIRGSCYGKKMFGEDNQWQKLIKLLQTDKQSRRAVVSFYDNISEENLVSKDIACITNIQFLIRDGKLNCITNMRSNDIIWGLCYDLFLITLIQELLALELNLELGWYQHNASSLHLYEHHFEKAENILKEGIPSSVNTMSKIINTAQIEHLSKFEKELRELDKINEDILNSLGGGAKEMAESLIGKSNLVINTSP